MNLEVVFVTSLSQEIELRFVIISLVIFYFSKLLVSGPKVKTNRTIP